MRPVNSEPESMSASSPDGDFSRTRVLLYTRFPLSSTVITFAPLSRFISLSPPPSAR
jgi:hypothetical protein